MLSAILEEHDISLRDSFTFSLAPVNVRNENILTAYRRVSPRPHAYLPPAVWSEMFERFDFCESCRHVLKLIFLFLVLFSQELHFRFWFCFCLQFVELFSSDKPATLSHLHHLLSWPLPPPRSHTQLTEHEESHEIIDLYLWLRCVGISYGWKFSSFAIFVNYLWHCKSYM